jgi:hypothetical protein
VSIPNPCRHGLSSLPQQSPDALDIVLVVVVIIVVVVILVIVAVVGVAVGLSEWYHASW